ncbi:MAG TPA: MBL fold metallo-hydrolase [Solirubrobacteraceae bacterium]|nr:MBL fold metallo-hydrolase [Solirubrobacteraceae bacterium]
MSPHDTIHHLDCGTMCPRAAHLVGLVDEPRGALVAHCLLIEAADGLVLLDTGFGTGDVAAPKRLGPARHLLNPRLDPAGTAVAQVRALGHDPADVRHVLITHLDLDHAGGLGDFPQAEVHVHATELEIARRRPADARLRYRPAQWAHGPRWVEHAADGESWFGFQRVRVLGTGDAEIAMIPLPGHTAGHSGYAIRTGEGWLLHCGDAYLHHDEVASPPVRTRGRTTYHRINSFDARARLANADRLSELAREHGDEVALLCSHDPSYMPR